MLLTLDITGTGKILRQTRVITATGYNLITQSDKKDLTLDKVREIVDENRVTLVVFDQVKDQIINRIKQEINALRKNPNSNKSMDIEKLNKLLSLSNMKICSFTELIDRDIPSVLGFWGENI